MSRFGQGARSGLFVFVWLFAALFSMSSAIAAPYAAMVMDARTGEVIHSRNADTRLHPASLTKMMTLYIAFQAVERGEVSLDTKFTITQNASSEPPSKLGLRTGQKISLRYLIRAAAIKSANDAATAIGIGIEGSEAAFADRMNRTAAAMGMTKTTFRNANGLTQSGHLSTARDMSVLGRHMIYDFPQYYNLFSRLEANAGVATVHNTNRRFLNAYKGADGIKTGFTNAAGFNLVASAQRGNVRIIGTVFGGTSTANRNARMAELLDMGFSHAGSNVPLRKPAPVTAEAVAAVVTGSNAGGVPGGAGKTIRVTGIVTRSLRPAMRPVQEPPTLVVAEANVIAGAVAAAMVDAPAIDDALVGVVIQSEPIAPAAQVAAVIAPKARPAEITMAAATLEPEIAQAPAAALVPLEPTVVTRISTSGGHNWGINVGRYASRYEAERVLLKVALNEMSTLDGSLRRVVQSPRGYDANFMGLTRETADLACRRLSARGTTCFMVGQGS